MKLRWLSLTPERRVERLNQATEATGLPDVAIEKDWWVTVCLKAVFQLEYSEYLVFKGGTSLSKGWELIQRFSEDIDLGLDRRLFGSEFEGEISKSKIQKLRRTSCEFISNDILRNLTEILDDWGATDECELFAQPITDPDKDPQVIEVQYASVLESSAYLPQRVWIEVGSRSLIEPYEPRGINAILSSAVDTFVVPTVLPQRTFLEKIFLLHEEYTMPTDKLRLNRLSRHLYDLERLMDTEHGLTAIENLDLYRDIVRHRERFNPLRGLDYRFHEPRHIRIVPPESLLKAFEQDYATMSEFMIYGESLSFPDLIKRLDILQERMRKMA